MNIIAYAIVTIPDTEAGRRQFDLEELGDKDAAKAMFHLIQQSTGSKQLPLYLQKIAAIATIKREGSYVLESNSMLSSEMPEDRLLKSFLDGGLVKWPDLVAWDHEDFVKPVMNCRIMKYALPAERYFPVQYREGMVDLRSILTGPNHPEKPTLHEIASLMDVPYGEALDGKTIWKAWLSDDHQRIREYCLQRAMMTYRIYLRYLVNRGDLTAAEYSHEVKRVSS